jgi:hypothetical protein
MDMSRDKLHCTFGGGTNSVVVMQRREQDATEDALLGELLLCESLEE